MGPRDAAEVGGESGDRQSSLRACATDSCGDVDALDGSAGRCSAGDPRGRENLADLLPENALNHLILVGLVCRSNFARRLVVCRANALPS